MHTKLSTLATQRNLTLLGFGTFCILCSFLIGIRSAGEVQPFEKSEARQAGTVDAPRLVGDVDGNGWVDVDDAITVLNVVEGLRDATPFLLLGDPNHDDTLTASDALHILSSLSPRNP